MRDEPLFRFGIIADVQYCDCAPATAMNRYYRRSMDKLSDCLMTLAQHDLRFILDVGDLIDRDFASFDAVLPIYETANVPVHHTLGNHDYAVNVAHLDEVSHRLQLTPPGYYSVDYDDWRLVVLNGNEVSLFATRAGTPLREEAELTLAALQRQQASNAQEWNGGVSETQLAWLDQQLAQAQRAGQSVIVVGHYPLYPAGSHNLWNDTAVITLLERYPSVVAYFNGHNHAGNYGRRRGIHYVNLKGMVETESENTFAVVAVFTDRLVVQGFGREVSRELAY